MNGVMVLSVVVVMIVYQIMGDLCDFLDVSSGIIVVQVGINRVRLILIKIDSIKISVQSSYCCWVLYCIVVMSNMVSQMVVVIDSVEECVLILVYVILGRIVNMVFVYIVVVCFENCLVKIIMLVVVVLMVRQLGSCDYNLVGGNMVNQLCINRQYRLCMVLIWFSRFYSFGNVWLVEVEIVVFLLNYNDGLFVQVLLMIVVSIVIVSGLSSWLCICVINLLMCVVVGCFRVEVDMMWVILGFV